ncbi:MAG: hypothetical protein WD981_03600, partial [Gaiellaceae bacterium]
RLALQRPRTPVASTLAFLGIVMPVAWIVALSAVFADLGDADGWVDCWPSCTEVQLATGATLTSGGLIILGVGVAELVVAVARLRRSRDASSAKRT